jgi:diguanylate cyclase (GGDEF)-like protein
MLRPLVVNLRDYLKDKSVRWLIVGLCLSSSLTCAVGATGVLVWQNGLSGTDGQVLHLRVVLAMVLVAAASAVGITLVVGRLLRPVHAVRQAMSNLTAGHYDAEPAQRPFGREFVGLDQAFRDLAAHIREADRSGVEAKSVLATRTQTVDRLLEFSQTIQGAGRPEQVYQTLSYFLQAELGLAGLVVLSVDPESSGPTATSVKTSFPADLLTTERLVADVDAAVCPCLRQNLPRLFACERSPIRCAIDNVLSLPPAHPAYCIPFNIRKSQCVAHMLLPIGQAWTEDRRQLAHTYVNTAHSALVSLHLLSEAERQSMTDVLTGLYNRRSMESLLEREVALAERHGHALSVVMIDMDRFKDVNDTFGHAAGDFMLKAFADCVRITLRKTDLAFRYGGDEFCITLPQTPIEQAQAVVQKLRQAYMSVDFSDAIARMDHQPTLSIGVAQRSKPNIMTLPALLAAADAALYDAKADNRNCIKLFSPPQAA